MRYRAGRQRVFGLAVALLLLAASMPVLAQTQDTLPELEGTYAEREAKRSREGIVGQAVSQCTRIHLSFQPPAAGQAMAPQGAKYVSECLIARGVAPNEMPRWLNQITADYGPDAVKINGAMNEHMDKMPSQAKAVEKKLQEHITETLPEDVAKEKPPQPGESPPEILPPTVPAAKFAAAAPATPGIKSIPPREEAVKPAAVKQEARPAPAVQPLPVQRPKNKVYVPSDGGSGSETGKKPLWVPSGR